ASSVTANAGHSCAVRDDHGVSCWGNNTQNEIGTITGSISCQASGTQFRCTPTPQALAMPPIDKLGMADQASCAIAMDGTTVYCWGTNGGEVGGPIGNLPSPTVIADRAGSQQLIGGQHHLCSLAANGDVLCAGMNTYGEVGNGSQLAVTTPTTVISAATAIGAGFNHTCAVTDGNVACWGANAKMQADGATTNPGLVSPTLVAGVTNAKAVAAGSEHTCALISDGTVKCWGSNQFAQLGMLTASTTSGAVSLPLSQVTAISAGVNHTCTVDAGGRVVCWGEGYSTPGIDDYLVTVTLQKRALSITSGSYHDCAVVDGGDVYCWGWNAYGQLGTGVVSEMNEPPSRVHLCP
ncbi:MAG TPA: hypothetical protein VMZ53_12355, partial [Kofleriaceae bacterium]|nr:hypothetical protein [Kofleriaceae bacterium]